MPLIAIRGNQRRITRRVMRRLFTSLPPIAAKALSCSTWSPHSSNLLAPTDIMIEVDNFGRLRENCKDIHIRVYAHDYRERRNNLDKIRKMISEEVVKHLPAGVSWYVWVLLAPTSYGSDTE